MTFTEEEKRELMGGFVAQILNKEPKVKLPQTAKGSGAPVETGNTEVVLTRRRVPPHLHNIGKNPEAVVIEPRKVYTHLSAPIIVQPLED